jgi:DNA-binding CsgD family transcriptional regulator
MTLVLRRVRGDSSGVESAQVLVMMLDGTQPVVARDPDLQQLFGFTPGETKLANLLMAGKSMAESCDDLGICPSTGCSHLRKMFKKTGSHRQGELVALLLRSIGLVRNGGPAAISEGGRSTSTAPAKNDVGFPDLIQVDVDTDL